MTLVQALDAAYVGDDPLAAMYVGEDQVWSAEAAYSPLTAVAWHTAFWASGPEFAALAIADGAAVTTMPDEASTNDATQATAGKRPTYRASSAGMGNRPVIEFDGTDDALATAAFTALSQPNEMFMIGRVRNASPGATAVIFTGIASGNVHQFAITTASTWRINAGSNASGGVGTANTTKHRFRFVWDTVTDTMFVDGVSAINADAGAHTLTGLTFGATVGGGGSYSELDLAFFGLSDAVLSTDERNGLIAWAQSFYGVA